MLTLLSASAAAQNVPTIDSEAGAIAQCHARTNSEPSRAATLARHRLAGEPLTATHEFAWLLCLLKADGILGRRAEAVATADRAQALLDSHWSEFTDLQKLVALNGAGTVLQSMGETDRALTLLKRAHDLGAASTKTNLQIQASLAMAMAFLALDAPEVAERHLRQARDLGQGHAFGQNWLDYQHGIVLTNLKRYDEALAALDDYARPLSPDRSDAVYEDRAAAHRAVILSARGQQKEAAALLAATLAQQRLTEDVLGQAYTQTQIAALQWAAEDREKAVISAQQALALSERGNYVREKEEALRLLAAFYSSLGHTQQAFDALERADAIALATLESRNQFMAAAVQASIAAKREAAASAGHNGTGTVAALFQPGTAAALLAAAAASMFALLARRRERVLRELDPLTGLLNRSAAIARLEATASTVRASQQVFLLVVVDRFEAVNDLYGYEIGDRVLRQLAAQVRKLCGPKDLAARWSEDGFLVVIEEAVFVEANARAEDLRRLVVDGGIDLCDGDSLKISVSIGMAPSPFFPQDIPQDDWHDSLRLAIRALQSARQVGTSAWASIWGVEAQDNRSTLTIARSPQDAAASGQVRLEASSPLAWQS